MIMKKQIAALLCAITFATASSAAPAERRLCVMQFNVWQEGTVVPGGFEAIADEISRWSPDIVMLSEVRNYDGTRFCDRITEALERRGLSYHSFLSDDSGLLSRSEISDSSVIYPYGDDHGSVYKLVTEIDGHRIAAYTAHLDYLNDTYYEVRGYDGSNWSRINALTDTTEILRRNMLSERDEAALAAAADIAAERTAGSIVFLGGDLNEPSGADWTEATASTADHNGVVIDWPTLAILREAGMRDAYREFYPDPVAHPGYTYPASNPLVGVDKLSWAPEADERERIDYIFYHPDEKLTLSSVDIIGPQGDIVRGERTESSWALRDVTPPLGVWPSDHRAVVARFVLHR